MSKGYAAGKKMVAEKKDGPGCFNYRDTSHFARGLKSKKVDVKEDYEVKYKKVLASLKIQNIDVKVLVAELERWVDDEESFDDDKGNDKCLTAHTDSFVTDEVSSDFSSFEA
ncbi:unnamed protein product [Lactuca virosa]|uniref:Uncharacterized protein n=1 Tax=Lactuca virosa TaxID=75947 RepID=A0AAU9NBF9_9ASTR|nr:unnamed protein product [Lactuca virosa]